MKKILSLSLILLLLVQLWSGLGLTAAAASDTPTAKDIDVEVLVTGDYAVTAVPEGAVALDSASAFSTMNAVGTYYLTADISVVSTYAATFKGKLYGNGHTITVSGRPAFGELNGATVCDLRIAGAISASEDYLGALAKKAYGATIVGITNEATVHNAQKGKFAGGIVGYAENTTLKYCVNKGAITGHTSETRLGGLVGQMDNAEASLTLENCINYGAVTGVNQTGGLVSRVENGAAVIFKKCANFGAMTVTASDGGGIIGKITSVDTVVTFESCYNSAAITGATYTGGLVGPLAASELTVTDCHNGCFVKSCACGGMEHGKLTNYTGGHTLGGLIGNFWCAEAKVTITDCSNGGDLVAGGTGPHPDQTVTGASRTGGIAAVMECAQVTVKNCHNSGDISSNNYIGGVFARLGAAGTEELKATVIVEDCSNSGKLNTDSYAGGIVGYQQYASQLTFTRCENSGTITTKWNAAGILCRTDNGRATCLLMTFDDCHNTGDITAQGTAGGIAGIFTGTYELINRLTFTNCTNKGDITTPNYAGGISGITDVKNYDAMDCRNDGGINIVNQNDETAMVGGIAARTYGAATFTDCVNTGNIVEKKIYKDGDQTIYDLYAGGIAGWAGRNGLDYKSDVAVFESCVNASTVVAKEALSEEQGIVAAGIVGVARSTCYAKRCLVVGQVNGTRQVAGITGLCSQNNQSGSEFNTCVVAAELYNNGAKVTDRTHGVGGIACYVWGDVHVFDCVVTGDIRLDVSGSELEEDQRRPVSALVGYTNNPSGEFKNNFFAGQLMGGEGTDCIVVMCAFTVDHNVADDESVDIFDNYSYYEYPLHYNSDTEYSESTTPVLTEDQIADGISFADILVGDNPNMEVVRTCVGIEVPMLSFMRMDYEWALELTGGHDYVENCDTTCIKCGKEKVELVHVYDHDCDTECNHCQAEREVADHDYGPWITVKTATETETGLRKSTCRTCGFEETSVIPVLSVTPPATGESDGQNAPADGTDADKAEEGSMLPVIIGIAAGIAVIVVVIVVIAVVKKSKKKAKNGENAP